MRTRVLATNYRRRRPLMARKWYDHKAGENIEWYVDNGTDEPLEVWLNGRLFRIVEPNDYVTKNFGDILLYKLWRRKHSLEIKTPSRSSALEKCSFMYPYDVAGQPLACDYSGAGASRKRYFIYNIRGVSRYQVIEVTYGGVGDGVRVAQTVVAQRCVFVRLDGVYWSIGDVPESVHHDYHAAIRHYLILRSDLGAKRSRLGSWAQTRHGDRG
jgi:hypothetical protein